MFRVFAIMIFLCAITSLCYGQAPLTFQVVEAHGTVFEDRLEVTITGSLTANKRLEAVEVQACLDGQDISGATAFLGDFYSGQTKLLSLKGTLEGSSEGKPWFERRDPLIYMELSIVFVDPDRETETETEATLSCRLFAPGQISFSELMFTSRGGPHSLPQWVELYNNSDTEIVNLSGWQLTIEARDTDGTHRHAVISLQELIIPPKETALIVTWNGRHSEEIQDSRVYRFVRHYSGDFEQNEHRNMVLGLKGFFLKLVHPSGTVSDTAGNIDGDPGTEDKPLWEIPAGTTEDGERTSLFRRYANGGKDPLDGTDASNWRRAANFGRVGDLSALAVSRYYGRNTDIGNPGYKGAGALPVALSSFRAVLKETGVLLSWTTESELENAGFNILRSVSKNGHFLKVNPRLIQGAGTTSERNTYTWTDTTAKPTTVYFYQIEDISYSGERTRFATIRMRGYVSAQDKLATRWADLKNRE